MLLVPLFLCPKYRFLIEWRRKIDIEILKSMISTLWCELQEVGRVLLPNGGGAAEAATEKKPKVDSVTKEAVVEKVA